MTLLPDRQGENFLLRAILDGTAADTGAPFFRSLVKNLSQALGTYGAWVTEHLPAAGRLRALAFWLGEGFIDHYEYDVKGTPCEKVLKAKTYLHIPDRVVELFPGDPDLPEVGAVSYIGFPLMDTENNILGNLAVLDQGPMPDSFRNLALFRIFAARATAELLRLRAETRLQEREEQLRGVFDGALDAIVELDQAFNIVMVNPSAQRLLDLRAEDAPGSSFEPFLTKGDFRRLAGLIRKLGGQPPDKRVVWIPQGLTAVTTHGEKIRAEATLSQFSMHGKPYYVLIIRNINERYEAERMIESLRDETLYLRDKIRTIYNHGKIIGRSRAMARTLELVAEVAPTNSTVLIYGETGTGKELIARAIHDASQRRDRPMITVNCAAIPETLIESEFFGHAKGAFTGATQHRDGRFGLAHGGTIFLDEIGELGRDVQAKLLRVLQEGEFSPVGSSRSCKVDVRVIAATNRDLSQAVQEKQFRTDLFYRLNVFPITVPPLRDRGDDIGLLADYFVEKYAADLNRQVAPLAPHLLDRLKRHNWPGNVRELQNVIERSVITARQGRLNIDFAITPHAPSGNGPKAFGTMPSRDAILTVDQLRRFERDNLLKALEKCQWRVAGKKGAARMLGMPPTTLQSRMAAMMIKRPDHPAKS